MESDDTQLSLEPGELENLAIFPLPDGILFPHTTIRLHIFEPRYRELVEDSLDAEAPISVAMISADGRRSPENRARVHPVAGAGAIIAHQSLAGGRYNILVRGLGRVRIIEELDVSTRYRRVRAALLEDSIPDPRKADLLLKTIQNCLFNIQASNTEVVEFLLEAFTAADSPGAAADILAAVIFGDSRDRQRSLSEVDVVVRLEAILSRLVEMVEVASRDTVAQAELLN